MTAPETRTAPDGGSALVLRHAPGAPQAAVLLLHGGRADGLTAPTWLNLPGRRMRPFASAVRRAARPHPLLVAEVRYRHRGWNGPRGDAARDARRALDELRDLTAPELPVVLVGHSMGGRAALRVAGDPRVAGVVALAPWIPAGEPVEQLDGRTLLVLHDERDRITEARRSWAYLARARAAGARGAGIVMPEGRHAMLRDAGAWHRLTGLGAAAALGLAALPEPLRAAADGPGDGRTTAAEVLAALDHPHPGRTGP
ncbi:alpha/beta fold hydrolase [Streptomyces sp. NPDC047097]|uniref:alpha/beta hydrolase n=1 Tax=Streptomyces sp. NPDC047097 TaxID=3155260 RepID=UPI0033CEBAB3